MTERWQEDLRRGCATLGLAERPERIEATGQFIAELLRWNRQTNLTAITDPQEIVHKHVLDCLAAMPAQLPARVCDVGSGAGLPGLFWAWEQPQAQFVSIDARQRKAAFQAHMARVWKLPNFSARHERVEDETEQFDLVTFRAFAPLEKALGLVQHLLTPGGRIRALKGPGAEAELEMVDPRRWGYTMTPLAVPGLDAQRYVIELKRLEEEPAADLHSGI